MTNIVQREPTQLEVTRQGAMDFLRGHRDVLEQYADAVWEKAEGASGPQIVAKVLAAMDAQLRALDRPVSPASVLLALWSCLALRLIPHGGPLGHAYLTAFKGQATLIVGVAGWQELLCRAGVTEVVSGVVCLDDFVGGELWWESKDKPPPVRCFGLSPPIHIARTDLHLPEAWSVGYVYAKRDGEWMHPYLLAGSELRTRLAAARARNPRSYAHKHPASWVRNQMVLRFARSRRVSHTDISVAAGMLGRELVAVAPVQALGAAEKLAELTDSVMRIEDAEGAADMSPGSVMTRTLATRVED